MQVPEVLCEVLLATVANKGHAENKKVAAN